VEKLFQLKSRFIRVENKKERGVLVSMKHILFYILLLSVVYLSAVYALDRRAEGEEWVREQQRYEKLVLLKGISMEYVKETYTQSGVYGLDWSPCGSWIIYEGKGLEILEVKTHRVINLSLEGRSPRWDPTGTKFIFERDGIIYLAHIEGLRVKQLIQLTRGTQPCFSPNGNYIAFIRNDHLIVRELKSGKETVLQDALGIEPDWSPRGDYIAYTRLGPKGDFQGIELINFVNPKKRRMLVRTKINFKELQEFTYSTPRWSPCGSLIVCEETLWEYPRQSFAGKQIVLIKVSSGKVIRLTKEGCLSGWSPTWSPQGNAFAFGTRVVQIIRLALRTVRQLKTVN